ncbi:DUF6879 family protein [Catenulispora pinisilvae]|uniref:DUF6879 family protein n=1 Tax=Catenulispora pinisilvae TaxID=2705253 RepID=UPI001E59E923|nr:DUF6879 family protein [Catenulispora pinisilvae]
MIPPESDPFDDLIAAAERSVVHLELRDTYAVDPESKDYAAWLAGDTSPRTRDIDRERRKPWLNLVRDTVARGVEMRRARVVSLPPTDYIRFEHSGAPLNIEAGEEVRWLDRADAVDFLVPAADLWLFDRKVIRFGLFSGDGALLGYKVADDPVLLSRVATAFEAVWERAVPHDRFNI